MDVGLAVPTANPWTQPSPLEQSRFLDQIRGGMVDGIHERLTTTRSLHPYHHSNFVANEILMGRWVDTPREPSAGPLILPPRSISFERAITVFVPRIQPPVHCCLIKSTLSMNRGHEGAALGDHSKSPLILCRSLEVTIAGSIWRIG